MGISMITHFARSAVTVAVGIALAACGGRNLDVTSGAVASSGLGSPCVPVREEDPGFAGANLAEVSVETGAPGCGGGSDVCLSDHFQGRVTCPYGTDVSVPACTVPGSGAPVAGPVLPQCTDRLAADAVFCSCRCANASGRTDDGASYCTCPGSMTCAQLVVSLGIASADVLAGAYCVKPSSAFDPPLACSTVCDPRAAPCP
jgi:hypothetical protein